MELKQLAAQIIELSGFLAKSVEEIWENHIDKDLKEQFNKEDVMKCIEEIKE